MKENGIRIGLRKANENDCELLWKWRNEEETRKLSFNDEFIPLEEHKKWFLSNLNDKNTIIYIILNEKEESVGQVRLNISNKEAEINIGLDRGARGKGYGTEVLRKVSDLGFSELSLQKLIGYIKESNQKSIKAFLSAGFVNNGLKSVKGHKSVEMVLERK